MGPAHLEDTVMRTASSRRTGKRLGGRKSFVLDGGFNKSWRLPDMEAFQLSKFERFAPQVALLVKTANLRKCSHTTGFDITCIGAGVVPSQLGVLDLRTTTPASEEAESPFKWGFSTHP